LGVNLVQENKLIRSLVANTKQGSNSAFKQLYQMNVGRVFALNLRLLADFKLGEEATKEVFITTWERISQMRDDITFASWLKGLTVSNALEKIRKKDGLKNLETADKKHDKIPRRFESTISLFDRDILSLPERERIVFTLQDIEEYNDEETADMLMTNTEIIKESLTLAHQLLEASTNYVLNDSKSLHEKMESLKSEIKPHNDLWAGIFNAVNKMKMKTQEEIKETESFQEDSEEEKSNGLVNKKSKHYFGEVDEKTSDGAKKGKLSDYFKRFKK
jgi:RNA polymerase sigma-70 factor (ECF subfamily)